MLIGVCGSSGLGPVVGVPSLDRTALLRAASGRPAGHVILLTPRHTATVAREQAHVLVSGRPDLRVCVLPLDHHAFSLTVIASAVVSDTTWPSGQSDPGAAVQLIQQSATRSRSLVWYPRVWGLKEPTPTVGQLAVGLLRKPGFFTEVGVPTGLVRSRDGELIDARDLVYVPADLPSALHRQLEVARATTLPVTVEGRGPYSTKTSVELTVLVGAAHAPFRGPVCTSCTATLVGGSCAFCQHGPVVGSRTGTPGPRGVRVPVAAAVAAGPDRSATTAAPTDGDDRA